MPAKNKSNQFTLTRIYDAPVKLVWEAWTDPEQVKKWWGPRGFTLTHHSKDLRPGGHWDYTMHGPDGTDYPNTTTYHEVEKYSRLVYDHGGHKDRPPLFRVEVNFKEIKGKTKMDMTMICPTPEEAEEIQKFIKKANGTSTWDRLAEYLEKEETDEEIFVINRTFDAPIELMYEVWTNPEHFSKWLAPTGFDMKIKRANIKPGGELIYLMTNGQFTMHGRIDYLEFKKPNQLVYTQQFIDENEKISRHPGAPTWPETMKTTVTFAEEGSSRTRVTVKWEVSGKATKAELEAFIKERGGMNQGWNGSFDKLEEYLAKL